MEKIQLKSSNGTDNYLRRLSPIKGNKETSNTYALKTSLIPRYAIIENSKNTALEIPYGGVLIENTCLPDNPNLLIHKIDYIIEYGWVITLKNI